MTKLLTELKVCTKTGADYGEKGSDRIVQLSGRLRLNRAGSVGG